MTRLLALLALAAWGPDIRPGTVAGGIFTPGRPPAARFGDDPATACPDTPLARSIVAKVCRRLWTVYPLPLSPATFNTLSKTLLTPRGARRLRRRLRKTGSSGLGP